MSEKEYRPYRWDRISMVFQGAMSVLNPVFPVGKQISEAIVRRGLPLVFSTGYGGAGIREPFRDRPVVQKPFSQQDLKRTLIAAIAAGG